MHSPDFKPRKTRVAKWLGRLTGLLGLIILFLPPHSAFSGGTALTKYQVEAIFLFNFAKYVEWPAEAFPNTNAPFTIGVMGEDRFGDDLRRAVDGKTVNGRSFLVKHLDAEDPLDGCQILFISDSEAARMNGILQKAGTLPILTVGEDEQFAQNNGIVDFTLRDGKVRLEINLLPAAKAKLAISSRLLAVADVVKGKAN
jgi:hypothetical protein